MRALLLSAVMVMAACAPNVATTTEADGELGAETDALTGELKAAVPSLTVWLRPNLTVEQRDGRLVYVLRGRASQNLEGVNSFVMDDPFGFANVLSARTFEVVFDSNSELNTLAAGLRVFIAVRPTSATVKPATVAITLQPSFTAPTGSTSVFVRGDVWPIAVGDALTYRAIVRTTGGAPLTVTTDDGASWPTAKRDADEWNVDLSFNQLRAACDEAGEQVTFSAAASTGVKVKKATLGVAVKTFGLTRADVYETYPQVTCTPEVQACLDGLPAGTTDSERCGTWYQVRRCTLPWQKVNLFASPDDLTALTQARDAANAQLPAGKRTAFKAWGVMESVSAANVALVLNSWKTAEATAAGLVDAGPVSEAQVRAELKTFGNADPLVTAAQTVVYQQSLVARRYLRGTTGVVYVLYFSGAQRLVVLETTQP